MPQGNVSRGDHDKNFNISTTPGWHSTVALKQSESTEKEQVKAAEITSAFV